MPNSQASHIALKSRPRRREAQGAAGQGLVEFALTIPIVLFIIWAIIEMGWLLFVYSSVASASREAARYGAAVDNFDDCTGIWDAAKRVGFAAGIDDANILISYDNLKNGAVHTAIDGGCDTLNPAEIVPGARILVQVTATYSPLVPLPLSDLTLQSDNAHTIVTDLYIARKDTGGGGGGGGGAWS